MKIMDYKLFWVIDYHSQTGESHYLTYFFSNIRFVTMNRAILTTRFIFSLSIRVILIILYSFYYAKILNKKRTQIELRPFAQNYLTYIILLFLLSVE